MPVTPLGDVAKAALAAKLADVHGPYRVHVTAREALVVYMAARGEGVPELPWDIDVSNESAWESRWTARLRAAGVADEADATDFIGWLRASNAPAIGAAAQAAGLARTALRALETAGVVVTDVQRVAVERALAAAETGNSDEQCTSRRCAWMILTGEDASVEDASWWEAQFTELGGSDGGTIIIVGRKSYRELHKTTTTKFAVLTLERALRDERLFDRWLAKMVEKLQNAALPKAGLRLMQVVAQASTQSGGSWVWKRNYLEGYFFDEYLGLGLPKLMASASAFNAMGQFASAGGLKASFHSTTASTVSSGGSTVDLSAVALGGGGSAVVSAVGSDIGPSASMAGGGTDVGALAAVIQSAVAAAATPLSARLASLESGARAGAPPIARELSAVVPGRKCIFCGREVCDFIRGGDPCREAKQAETARNQANAAKRRAAESAAAAAKDKDGG